MSISSSSANRIYVPLNREKTDIFTTFPSNQSCLHVADPTPIICSPTIVSPTISPTHDIDISIPSNATPQLEHCPHVLHRILYEFSHVFSTNKYNVPKLNIPPVKINTTTDKIIALRPYRVPLHDQQEIQTQIEQMLQHGIIAPSVSPYASPITLVTKRDKTKRFCIDYRKLNEIIAPDVHPLPLIETILDKLSKAKYYSSVDIASAYWQVEVEPNSRNLLTFVTLDSQYEFCRLPYGFKNSPQIYHRAINQVMQKYKLNFVTHYFDDFIIFSDTLEDHLQHLQQFLTVCQHENIKLNYNKCSFFKTNIDFLGYTVTAGTYAPQTRNLDTISAIKPPTNQKTLQSFLGAVNVYNKFIPDYARLRAPLNKLLKKDVKWNWDPDCQQAFTTLKESLTSKPVLHLYQVGLPCRLYCDASTQGIAGILKQVHPDGQVHPVQYFSRALRAHERNYTVSELECLAIVESVDKFRIYLTGIKFTIYTDHQALQWLKTIKNPSGRLFRWSLTLSTYNYEIHYLKGSQQYEADLLSRNPFVGFVSADIIKQHQPTASPFNIDTNGLHTITRKGIIKIIIPETLQHTLMNKVHQEYNHPGISQMTRIITAQYYWKGISKSIEKFVKSCHTCQIIKRPKGKPYGALGQIPPPQQPFDLISIDTIAGISKYGHSKTYLHVIVDHLTRYAWTFPSKSTSTLTYIQTLKTVLQQGSPKRLLSDRAPAFTSEKFRKFLITHGIQPLLTTSNNPQANGLIERLNATITGKLRLAYLENPKASWTQLVKRVTQTYNNTPHSVTSFPPTYLMFNVIPPDLRTHLNPYPEINIAREIANSRTQNKHKKDKETFDKQHRTPHFEVNDFVLVKNYRHPDTGKLAPYFTGPYKIIEIISPNVVRIDRPNQPLNRDSDTIHVNKLKYYTENVLYITPPQTRFAQNPQRLSQDVFQSAERYWKTLHPDCSSWSTQYNKSYQDFNIISVVDIKLNKSLQMVETRSGKMQDPAQERIMAEESAKPQPGATIGRDASSDPVVLNPNIDIPKYDGSEDPRPWIESLEEIGFLYHWADYIISRYAAMNMTGSAKTWLNLHKTSFTSWENIKIRLIQDFSLDANKEELRMKLNRMQHWNEPAIRFAEDILVLCNKVDPAMEEETKIEHVIGGLKKEHSFALYLNPPKTTDDLLVVCKKMDSFEKKYRERVEKSRNLYNGPRYSRPQQQSRYVPPTAARNYQTTSRPQAPVSNNYKNDSPPTPRQYRNNFPQPSTPRRPDGKKLDMVEGIFLNIKIDDETLSHNFVILKTHLRTLILGRDFLKKMNAKIDCKQETIKYDLTNNHDEINFEMLKIKSAKDSIVPECSMKLIKALVETEDGEYIIEESSKMFQTNGLRLARSLINVINRETHIWITNPYPRPLKIMKNQTLAFGSSPAKINVSREREVEENKEPRFQINENLSPKEQKELKQVLERYGDLFSSRLGRTNLAKHRIDTEDAKPIKHKPYRVSAKERDIIKEQIDEMLTEGIIRPSSSPWSFPVILVKKRDGKYRFCVDYRKLNNVTVKDVYPIPRIDEVMDTLQGSTHFSAIDLRSGYWQVEVEKRDKEKTAFTTAHGLYEFNVMPFGLCNAPATFERNMENMLGNLRWQICLCYLDDVFIYSPDFPTHLKRLEAVFRCFRESNLRLNDKKCRFAFEELEILGYITSKHGIKPAEHNIKAVRNFPRPKKVKEVQSFLGMCSYYRKFIKDFSKIADPLTNLIKKSVSFTWTERQEEAFQTLKTALLSPPILGHFNPNAPTYVHTDASNIGIGATLVQDIGGEEKVISYLSCTLSKAEQNYSTTEKECLAVVWSMSKLRPYLYGRHFKIVTDHHALCWLKNLKDPTGRLARWALKIQEYDFDIIHKSGKKHLDADGLSRGPLPETDWDEDFERLFLNQITDEEDKFIESVKKNLNGSRRSIAQNFKVEDGCLFKKNPNPEGRAWLLVVPEKKKREIMKEYHNHMSNGHLGVARTMYRIKSKYFWPSMLKDVSEFVKTCHLCQSRKGSNQLPSGLLQPIPPANFPFERIGIDFVGPLPSTKNRKKWIIVLTDYYTRYAETKAVSEATVKEVSKFLVEDIFLRHGAPQYLISDRGSQFTSNLMKEVMKTCKIKHCFTTSYHPQTNGLTERLNRTLINMLSMYVNTDQKNWDEILPFITHAYNTTIQETTGYSPFFLMFGREPTSLLDDRNISVDIDKDDYDEYIKHHLDKINRTRKLVINNTIKTQERMKKNYDKKDMERSYEPGELVAVWTPIRKIGKCEKLLRKYFGPYRILKKLSNVNYLIEPKDNPGQDPLIVHVSRIKPYFERIDKVNHEDRQLDKLSQEEVKKQLSAKTQGATPLLVATQKGHYDIVKYLLEECNANIEQGGIIYFKGFTVQEAPPLWAAAAEGHLNIVQLLVSHGANINATTSEHSTPLRAACYDGYLDIVRYLVENHADIYSGADEDHTCFMEACYNGHTRIVQFLLNSGFDINTKDITGETGLHSCAYSGNLAIMKMLLKLGAKMSANVDGITPMMAAAMEGQAIIVEYLKTQSITSPTDTVSSLELLGATLLDAKYDPLGAMRYWRQAMEERAKAQLPALSSSTPSLLAKYGGVAEARTLQELANIGSNSHKMNMQSLLLRERILGKGYPDTIHYILRRGSIYAKEGNFSRCIKLWSCALEMEQSSIDPSKVKIKEIITDILRGVFAMKSKCHHNKAFVSFQDLFHIFEMCIAELERVDKEAKLPKGKKDLSHTHQMLMYCIQFINLIGYHLKPFMSPAEEKKFKQALYQLVQMNPSGRCGWQLLHIASSTMLLRAKQSILNIFDLVKVIDLLLEVGADVNSFDHFLNTPLHLAVYQANLLSTRAIITTLLRHGAHLDYRNKKNASPLDVLYKEQISPELVGFRSLQCLAARAIK
ncbi:hypothetical protein LAZ67_10001072, partial [Cordylochernes scorpioides]